MKKQSGQSMSLINLTLCTDISQQILSGMGFFPSPYLGSVFGRGDGDADPAPVEEQTPQTVVPDPATGISDGEAKLLKEVMEKKAQLKAKDDQIKRLSDAVKRFDGVDLDALMALAEEKRAAETKALEEKGQWDVVKKQMTDENQKIIKEKDDTIKQLMESIAANKAAIDKLTLGNTFESSKFIQGINLSPQKVRTLYGSYFESENGVVVPYNKPAGEEGRAPLVNAGGEVLSFEEAISKIIMDDPESVNFMPVKVKIGASSSTTNGVVVVEPVKLTGVERIKAHLDAEKGTK